MRPMFLSVLLLSACGSVVPSTVARLNTMSPLAADPADFAVAITLPDGLGIAPDSARLSLVVARTDTAEIRRETVILERVDGAQVYYRINPADHSALRDAQATALAWKAENDAATSGSLSVNLAPCRVGEGPAPDARVSVAIRTDADGAFLPLVNNGPISAVAAPEELRNMGPCP